MNKRKIKYGPDAEGGHTQTTVTSHVTEARQGVGGAQRQLSAQGIPLPGDGKGV